MFEKMTSARLYVTYLASLTLAAMWLLSSCSRPEVSRTLGEIETYMDSHPDSRLTDLLAIDSAALRRPADHMLYEVLLTQALDKDHRSLASRDSIMQVAAEWFSARSDSHHALLAYYFLGRVKFEKEDYPECIVAMFKAHDLAKELDNKYWIGMSARGISDVYTSTYNSADALRYNEIEFENLRLSGRQPYINDAFSDLAISLSNSRDYDRVYEVAAELADSAKKYSDAGLINSSNRIISVTLMSEGKYKESIPYMKSVAENGFADVSDSIYLAFALVESGKPEEAMDILDKFRRRVDLTDFMKYKIYDKLGNRDSAFVYLQKEYDDMDDRFSRRFRLGLFSSVSNYYEMSRQLKEERLKLTQTTAWGLSVIVILVIIIGVLTFWHYRNRYNERLERNILVVQNLRAMLDKKSFEYDAVKSALKEKLKAEFAIFDELCQRVYESENQTTARKKVALAVDRLIEQLSGDRKKIMQLEQIVDDNYDNLMTELKTDLPNLKEADYNLFLFSVLGFSISSIALFLKEEKITNVYERKRRLKDKIKKLEASKRDKYLTALG